MFTGEKPDLLDIMPFRQDSIYVVGKDGIPQHWDGEEWLLSVEGLYPGGTWRIALNG